MRKSYLCFLIFFLYALVALQDNTVSGQDFKSVDSWLQSNTAQMGGRSFFIVYKDCKIIHTYAVNHLNQKQKLVANVIARRSGKEPNLEDYAINTRQPIASCSKWLSAALVMTFVDEGKLKLNDTVGKFLPALSKSGKGKITLAQCLSHTTSIQAPSLKESLADMREAESMDNAIDQLAAAPMEGEPGKVFRYSNAGLQIAGAVIERIGGKSFEDLFLERIAKPLEMKNTDFGRAKVALPAGGAWSTPEDYIQFLSMILGKGVYKGKRILSESSISEMQVNRILADVKVGYSPGEAGDLGYGFGEWVSKESSLKHLSKSVSSPGLFGSYPWVENDQKYCAFLMTYYLRSEGRAERYKEFKDLVRQVLR